MAITREDLMRAGIGANTPMPMPAQAAPQRQGLLGGFFGPEGRDARARLAIGLEGMTLNPNQALIGQLQQGIESRETAAQKNATAAWLRSRGRDDLAAAMEGGLPAADALRIAMEPADPMAAINLETAQLELARLRNPQPEFRRATPEEAATYGAQSGQFGPDGRFYPVDVPQGMTIESDGAGGFRMVQGPAGVSGTGKPPTEGQLAGAGYLQRMTAAENILRDLERRQNIVAIPVEKTILMDTGIEGYVLNPAEQQVAQAQRDWVRSKLRKESGAVIGADEMAAEIRTYFPQPGEGAEVIAQKAEARRRAERQMQIGSGTAAEQAGAISQPYAAPIRAGDLSAAGIGTQGGAGSQPVVIDGVTIRKVN
jgi:hypothetical protein